MSLASIPPIIDPDWNEIWEARQKQHESSKHFNDPSHNWNKRENAERYDISSRSEYDDRVKITIAGLDIKKNSRVLDIGAGPGTLAIPIAPFVREVTAIEPGEGMVSILNEHARKKNITNITSLQKRWEDVDIRNDLSGKYDIVLSSLSLTMEDIRESLAKMNVVSSRYVYIYWFADPPFWERMYIDLWPELHGETYYPGPKADCLFNVLYQMGIYPNIDMLPLDKVYRFSTRKEMRVFFRNRFAAKTKKQQQVLDAYLAPLIRTKDNEVVISGNSTLAKVWWKKAG